MVLLLTVLLLELIITDGIALVILVILHCMSMFNKCWSWFLFFDITKCEKNASLVFLYLASQSRTVILGSSTAMNVGTLAADPALPCWNWAASPRRTVHLRLGVADRGAEADVNGAHLQRALTAHHIWGRTTPPGKPPAISLCFWIAIVFRVHHIGAR